MKKRFKKYTVVLMSAALALQTALVPAMAAADTANAAGAGSEQILDEVTSPAGSEGSRAELTYRTDDEITDEAIELVKAGKYEAKSVIAVVKNLSEESSANADGTSDNADGAIAYATPTNLNEPGAADESDANTAAVHAGNAAISTGTAASYKKSTATPTNMSKNAAYSKATPTDLAIIMENYEDGMGEEPYAARVKKIKEAEELIKSGEVIFEDDYENVKYISITSENRAARYLLTVLLSDPRVISAEPNYLVEGESEDSGIDKYASFDSELDSYTGGASDSEDMDIPRTGAGLAAGSGTGAAMPGGSISGEGSTNTSGGSISSGIGYAGSATAADSTDLVTGSSSGGYYKFDYNTGGNAYTDYIADKYSDITGLQWANHTDTTGEDTDMLTMVFGTKARNAKSANIPGWNDTNNINGDTGNVIAVLDSGIDYLHPDLMQVMYEIPEDIRASLDCHLYGKNTISSYNDIDPMDDHGHGTHVSGIIAGAWDGGGISGAVNGPKLVAVKVLNKNKTGTTADIISGYNFILQLKKSGVPVSIINASIGSVSLAARYNSIIRALGREGVIVCMSSGNDNLNVDESVASSALFDDSSNVVVVNNSTISLEKAADSNYGFKTNLYAPGNYIVSTVNRDRLSNHIYLAGADPYTFGYDTFDSMDAEYDKTYQGVKAYRTAGWNSSGKWNLRGENGRLWEPIGTYTLDNVYDKKGAAIAVKSSEMNKVSDTEYRMVVAIPIDSAGTPFSIDDLKYASMAIKLSDFDNYKLNTCPAFLTDDFNANVWANSCKGAFYVRGFDMGKALAIAQTSAEINYGTTISDMIQHGADGRDYVLIRCFITLKSGAVDNGFELYLDCAGAGAVKTPYEIFNGTSMSAPLVSGCAAILQQQFASELAGLQGEVYSAKLKQLILQSTTQYSAFSNCSTGGQIDLDVNTVVRPVIDEAYAGRSLREVVIYGSNFGSYEGTVTVGGEEALVTSWSDDSIICELGFDLQEKAYLLVVTDAAGQTVKKFFVPGVESGNLYETTIVLPNDDYDTTSGDVYDDIKNSASFMQLAEIDGEMYLLTGGLHESALWKLDKAGKSISKVGSLPGNINLNSTRMYSDGKTLYILEIPKGSNGQILYSYTPSADEPWYTIELTGFQYVYRTGLYFDPAAGDSGKLYIFGGTAYKSDGTPVERTTVYEVDPVTGVTSQCSDKSMTISGKKLHFVKGGDGVLYCTGVFYDAEARTDVQKLYIVTITDSDLTMTDISGIVPSGVYGNVDMYYDICAYSKGIAFVGLRSEKTVDTYLYDGNNVTEFSRSASVGHLFDVSAGSVGDVLYAIGKSQYESDPMILRATDLNYVPPKPGDNPDPVPGPDPQPDPDEEPEDIIEIIDNGDGNDDPGKNGDDNGGSIYSSDDSSEGTMFIPRVEVCVGVSGIRGSIGYLGGREYIYYEPAGRWVQDAAGWWYSLDGTGAYLHGVWAEIGGKWYHFDGRGYMQEGFIREVTDENGAVVPDGAEAATAGKLTVKWYYLTPVSGEMARSLIEPADGYLYYMHPVNGSMQTGRLTIDGTEMYFRSDMPPAATYTLDPATGIYIRNSVDDIPYGAAIKR
ncbi:MAG: S8 family serine peptidase [Eubacteriales bacterium]|nr:S8 family serine peptidase [Eubacteriales bacterium]